MLGKIIPLSKITDRRGNLTVAEQLKDVPFEVKRAYWVYDVPGGRKPWRVMPTSSCTN